MEDVVAALQFEELGLVHLELIETDGAVDPLEFATEGDGDDVLLQLLHQLALVVFDEAATHQQEDAQDHRPDDRVHVGQHEE